jgi:hypothetical protein
MESINMKSGVTLIVAVILSWLLFGWAQAADLIHARAGEHGAFSRVVFEFQDVVRSKGPIITGRGKFYVTFLDSTTALPRRALNKTTKGVQSVKLIQKESHLIANIKLSFPYFRLKTFSLQNPDRVVIDAYRMSLPPKKIVPEESLHAEPTATHAKPTATHAKPTATVAEPAATHAELISMTIEDEPLGDVLKKISMATGYEFSLDDSWQSYRVTASLEKVSLHKGLKRILRNLDNAIIYGSDRKIKIIIYDKTAPE